MLACCVGPAGGAVLESCISCQRESDSRQDLERAGGTAASISLPVFKDVNKSSRSAPPGRGRRGDFYRVGKSACRKLDTQKGCSIITFWGGSGAEEQLPVITWGNIYIFVFLIFQSGGKGAAVAAPSWSFTDDGVAIC